MVEVGSTVEKLVRVVGGMAMGQAVELLGEAGVGKTLASIHISPCRVNLSLAVEGS